MYGQESNQNHQEILSTEIDAWCYAIEHHVGEVTPALIFRSLRALSPSFEDAINCGVSFDVLEIAKKFSRASRSLVATKEIAMSLMFNLPNPRELSEEGQYVVAGKIDLVEQSIGGVLEAMQKRWAWQYKHRLTAS